MGIYLKMRNIVYFKDNDTHNKFWNKLELKYASMMVKSEFIVDRTNNNNIYRIDIHEIPSDHHTKMTFEECCMERSLQIWKHQKPVVLFWSGGIDSTAAAVSLMETKPIDGEIIFRCTQNSIDEFPEYYQHMKHVCNVVADNQFLDRELFSNHNTIKITGECGDQLFGSSNLENMQNLMHADWHTIYNWDFQHLFPAYTNHSDDFYLKNKTKVFEFLIEHIEYCPFPIKTVFDVYWWLNFTLKWMDVDKRMIFLNSKCNQWESTISFFNTQNFQRWSLTNHDIKQKRGWSTYKQPAKDYINKYFKNEDYRKNKNKIASLINISNSQNKITDESIKLCLDDGTTWRSLDVIPQEVIGELLLSS